LMPGGCVWRQCWRAHESQCNTLMVTAKRTTQQRRTAVSSDASPCSQRSPDEY
jgi:hypothetical protein